ncbi:MAG: phosphate/phosphite/phosphonate ABC transporter substrate-binding protein [Planctomycetota bacterium]|jgi:phosphonate transport system substrate-binding protein|nr:phosphate/phosphite/phosphonate ABC transporter substrate-binding protein [Planctomycetota bacterium]
MTKFYATVLMAIMMSISIAFGPSGFSVAGEGIGGNPKYLDEDGDQTADLPIDPKEWINPDTLVFADPPLEDIGQDLFAEFVELLAKKTGKKVVHNVMAYNSSGIEDMRSGRLHIASFSTGATHYAVDLAGYVPIATKGDEDGFQGYRLIVIVRSDSPYFKLQDLRGKSVAHTTPSSLSGHIAPVALLTREGITPGTDYKVEFAGNHEKATLGVGAGTYDGACVGSSLFDRIAAAGEINKDDFRIIWQSGKFPTSSFGYVYNLDPDLSAKIREAFYEYRFTPEMIKIFDTDRFSPITYARDYKITRIIAESAGEKFDEEGLQKMFESDQEAAKKKAAAK